MVLQLVSFPAEQADVVGSWARTAEEALMWCSATAAPVPAAQVRAWADEDGVEQFGLYQDQRLVAYGEMWTDDQEAEVELARLMVDPAVRGQGLGRYLAADLGRLARLRHPRVLLRVHPGNGAALRCYAAAGFEPVGSEQAAAWNTGQPICYVWLSLIGCRR
jgi:ribosomal protein S18 acetylase RimI-like enzyme